MGAKWWRYGHARVEARKRIFEMAMGRLRRGACAVYPGTRLAHSSAAGEQLRSVDLHLRVEKLLRIRLSLCGAIVHAPTLPYLGRLSRYPGHLNACQGHRLFREQPARDVCATSVSYTHLTLPTIL